MEGSTQPNLPTTSPSPTRHTSTRPIVNGQGHGRKPGPGGQRRQGGRLLVLRPPAVGAAPPGGPAAAAVPARLRHVPGPAGRLRRVSQPARRVSPARAASRLRRRRLPPPAAEAVRDRGTVLRPGLSVWARYGVGLREFFARAT
jgi:hypothetical protein